MTKAKGRPRKGRLADMTSSPPCGLQRYSPPPHDEEYDYPEDFAEGVRMHRTMKLCEGRLVYFSVCLNLHTPEGWAQVARIDPSHGEIHLHQFRAGSTEIRTVIEIIPFDRGEEVVDRWYERACDMMEDGWREYLRRWSGDEE